MKGKKWPQVFGDRRRKRTVLRHKRATALKLIIQDIKKADDP